MVVGAKRPRFVEIEIDFVSHLFAAFESDDAELAYGLCNELRISHFPYLR